MNYLAHAYLSFHHDEVLVGNMISDFVKGNKKNDYSTDIYKGIMLHRAIDNFTDNHPATALAKNFFRPAYRLYSGAFVDIVYDHFLANDKSIFPNDSLLLFSEQTYAVLYNYQQALPQRFDAMLPYMKKNNWLYNCQYRWGIQNSFKGLVHRAAYMNDSREAFEIFEANYDALQQQFHDFFPQLHAFTWNYFQSPFPYPA
ncbi:MAG: ACP phosphodiesterase [Agriterribacter sp.]